MPVFPTLFLSHGAPDFSLHASPARDFLQTFGEKLGKPQAILILSSHYDMAQPSFSADEKPGMLYDFEGYPEEVSKIDYPAPGLPQLATIAATLVEQSGLPTQEIIGRGFDQGAWGPLSLLYPGADIPVVEAAIQSEEGAGHHFVLGRCLAPLRQHGVLIIGSGHLNAPNEVLESSDPAAPPQTPDWVTEFGEWVREKAELGDFDTLVDYKAFAPHSARNHPEPDHFMPFPFALGAAGEGAKGRRVHHSVQQGTLLMDVYLFE
ncbi:DODA-type extradiol aromatic ring-opening family dioxygenase [Beijerinckia indica]|uniref:Extradiol ring-cleavage dioxygenase class III protein subunit B n=1 Tax=Beijerinckia indica subsp. indica (strain ATCC 9039 / DSM 1715 / NCIMB 8712) TaxID=395963 RepID=B2IGY8_BEII9|nr:class III extradiol ring-cleavage dioxygenase [Beijerinckia indica]ACB94402.1 Extradiol ring-cleavage dioxygenase class III protein subunit B [Beijerinckia indica subsp. indica ATCC 9039]